MISEGNITATEEFVDTNDFYFNLETAILWFNQGLENYKGSKYESVIKARLLSDLKVYLFNLKNERENRNNPRFQKG